ncbi:hypothetical protein [Burkholderia multivorans]|uniref:hypothetical protein n=1 Tax=Burkholderia multivorans TaxID=87883 RepID=UPI0021C16837|nr:hypothetical protein [Burkholderia multivorans]
MADYLDDKFLTKSSSDTAQTPSEPKRKVGRPRGTTKAALALRCFQAELRAAIYQHEVADIFANLRRQSEGIAIQNRDGTSCAELQQEMRAKASSEVP